MFQYATSFNQSLCPWARRIFPVTTKTRMFYGTSCPDTTSTPVLEPSLGKAFGPFCTSCYILLDDGYELTGQNSSALSHYIFPSIPPEEAVTCTTYCKFKDNFLNFLPSTTFNNIHHSQATMEITIYISVGTP